MHQNHQHETIHLIPYVPGLAEYAARVRDEIAKREGEDFIIAVDLPHGLEEKVMAATRKLPKATVVVDKLQRGIPIIPSSAPVEAVRSFQQSGFDLRFIDASLPVTGNMQEYQHFIQQCSLFGIGRVLKKPGSYGISEKDLFKSWLSQKVEDHLTAPFAHLPDIVGIETFTEYLPDQASPYLQTRMQYMARNLQDLQKTGVDILFVCAHHTARGVLHYLDQEIPPIDDRYVVPTKICVIAEEDVVRITPEVPYFVYLYELFRDASFDRERWIDILYNETGYTGLTADMLSATVSYAQRLALTDCDVYPDLFNLVAAAKYVVNDDYALGVYHLAKSYPPSETARPNCAVKNITDYNFLPLGDVRTLTLKSSLLDEDKRYRRKEPNKKRRRLSSYHRFTRTPESYRKEREFMRYVTPRFTSLRPSQEEFTVEEYRCGLGEGCDVKETLRNTHSGKIYVKEPVLENTASYVFDYRCLAPQNSDEGDDSHSAGTNRQTFDWYSHFFFDRYYAWAGVGYNTGHHYFSQVLLAFTKLSCSPTEFFASIRTGDPLTSAVELAKQHADHVFVFTDRMGEWEISPVDTSRVRVLPWNTIPEPIYRKMSEFDIAYWRDDDKPGD